VWLCEECLGTVFLDEASGLHMRRGTTRRNKAVVVTALQPGGGEIFCLTNTHATTFISVSVLCCIHCAFC
jgi:hypothetical protein